MLRWSRRDTVTAEKVERERERHRDRDRDQRHESVQHTNLIFENKVSKRAKRGKLAVRLSGGEQFLPKINLSPVKHGGSACTLLLLLLLITRHCKVTLRIISYNHKRVKSKSETAESGANTHIVQLRPLSQQHFGLAHVNRLVVVGSLS